MQYTARTFSLPTIEGLSQQQLELHLGLYQGYVKHTNLLESELTRLSSENNQNTYIVGELRKRLGFEFSGMRLHELYFEQLENGAQAINADTTLYGAIIKQFGSFNEWFEEFSHINGRGPGWALLDYDPIGKQFFHVWASDHEIGQLASLPVIIALDHWEHAYLVDYVPADKQQYVDTYIANINWTLVADRFENVLAKKELR